MAKKIHENEREFILEVLKQEEDKIVEKFNNRLTEEDKYDFNKFVAIRNEIQKIKVAIAFEKGTYNKGMQLI